jgi:hypothetical protein
MKGLVNKKVINFRWDEKGFKLIEKRAKKRGMSKEAYIRFAIGLESRGSSYGV